MDKRELKLKIRNAILRIESAKEVNASQLVMRCPYCGDSQKDLSHGHFYIKINLMEDEPILFHCFRCDISGVLTPSILRTFKIHDLQINSGLLSYNKQSVGMVNKSLGIVNNDLNFIMPIPKEDEKTIKKFNYIRNRMEYDFTIEELVNDFKVVFNLGEFLTKNDIETLTVKKEKALMLHNDYVGFLSTKNEFINFRDITGNGKNKRYEKYSLFNNLDNTRKFYTIPNQVDLMTTRDLTLNIAEGSFDIIGVYLHVMDKQKDDMIYTAVNGSGYISVLKYFIQMGMFGNVNINIFSDKDREPRFYVGLGMDEIKEWVKSINLFYNEKGKDYGVSKDKIKIIKKKLNL